MPIYIYQHPSKKTKVVEIIQGMNDVHEYVDSDGVQWTRVFTVPQGAVSTKLDPFNAQQYIEKLGQKRGTMGDALDRSAELSAERAAKAGGVDPIRQKYLDDYAKKRKGKRHPLEIREKLANMTIKI